MAIFKGAGVAIATPFKKNDLSVDFDKLDELIDFQCQNGTDAIIICGTTGESATLTEAEHKAVVKFAIERTKGRIPVIAGTGSNSTATAKELSAEAAAAGADGLLVVTPYYNKATQAGLIAHYQEVAKAAKGTPIIMYSVASRTGMNIEPATVVTLVRDVDNIVGVKEASGSIAQVAKIMSLAEGQVDLYSGNDDQIVPLMSLGGLGVISVLSNIAPQQTHDITELFFAGKLKESTALQLKAIPLINALFNEVNPIPVKKGLELLGRDSGAVRMPLSELTPANTEKLAAAMKEFGLL